MNVKGNVKHAVWRYNRIANKLHCSGTSERVQDGSKAGWDTSIEESAGEEVGRARNVDVEMDVWCYKGGQNKEWNY